MKNIKYLISLSIVAVFMFACKPDVEEFNPASGDIDLTKYVSVGNSLTAGYADGALYDPAQSYSYPKILSEQFMKVGGGSFTQPTVTSKYGIQFQNPPFELKITADCMGNMSLGPVLTSGEQEAITPGLWPVNNLGVPGAKTYHLAAPGYGNPLGLTTQPPTANPYYVRFAPSYEASVLQAYAELQATFFTLWIGNNDVLGYAIAGGENTSGEFITPMETTGTIPGFAPTMNAIVNTMTTDGQKGAMANIPDIMSTPFFTTVPSYGLVLTADLANALNAAYAPYNAGAEQMGLPKMEFKEGPNAFVIQDLSDTYAPLGGMRQAKMDELILLSVPQDSLKCGGWGSQKPIPATYVLDTKEIENISNATTAFNNEIKALADNHGLAFVDVNAIMKEAAANGLVFDGLTFTPTFVTGGIFSLDGIHLSKQGNAIVANYFIDAINETYGANIPKVIVSQYPGIAYP